MKTKGNPRQLESFTKEVLIAFIRKNAHFICRQDLIREMTRLEREMRLDALHAEATRLQQQGVELSGDIHNLPEYLKVGDQLRRVWAEQERILGEMIAEHA